MSFIIASILSGCFALLIILTQSFHEKFTADKAQGVQKFHSSLTPRIGGLVLLTGLIAGISFDVYTGNLSLTLPIGLAIALTPVFVMGMVEDFTKKVAANVRFVAALISGAVFYLVLDSGITHTGLFWVDSQVLTIPLISLLLTMLMMAGVSNATNIIDGFNGLLLGFSLMAATAIAWVSFQVGDTDIFSLAVVLMGSLVGLMVFNFPMGKLFTGDGGAYMIGFLLAALSILLVNRNSMVSPWFPMLLLLYPITETLFSIFRRILIENASPFDPDDKHLHTLMYRALLKNGSGMVNDNARTSMYIWPLMLSSILPSVLLWQHTTALMITNGLFLMGYYLVYQKLASLEQLPACVVTSCNASNDAHPIQEGKKAA